MAGRTSKNTKPTVIQLKRGRIANTSVNPPPQGQIDIGTIAAALWTSRNEEEQREVLEQIPLEQVPAELFFWATRHLLVTPECVYCGAPSTIDEKGHRICSRGCEEKYGHFKMTRFHAWAAMSRGTAARAEELLHSTDQAIIEGFNRKCAAAYARIRPDLTPGAPEIDLTSSMSDSCGESDDEDLSALETLKALQTKLARSADKAKLSTGAIEIIQDTLKSVEDVIEKIKAEQAQKAPQRATQKKDSASKPPMMSYSEALKANIAKATEHVQSLSGNEKMAECGRILTTGRVPNRELKIVPSATKRPAWISGHINNSSITNEPLREKVNRMEWVYVKGIQRLPYGLVRKTFQSIGIPSREIADISFPENNVIEILIRDAAKKEEILSKILNLPTDKGKKLSLLTGYDPIKKKLQKSQTKENEKEQLKTHMLQSLNRVKRTKDFTVKRSLQMQIPLAYRQEFDRLARSILDGETVNRRDIRIEATQLDRPQTPNDCAELMDLSGADENNENGDVSDAETITPNDK
ncbi:uncharacterized protein BJ171DRAFT_507723 [Polychytrium aggregatum]|uniref:uncharacterized protein n=1 Tax=Polychytrium aggregatum TaxID=110093 RepID=UPI0022FECB57|nr:uncharacterized protein BJ171DRAFT_507723 [Polychytrium aggregatum]KAI9204129.1 hypothetical protein BJ171DRAFT_507723 [Polychytrium aggregatum]